MSISLLKSFMIRYCTSLKFKRILVFWFLHLCKKSIKSLCKIFKRCQNFKKLCFLFLIISPMPFNLHRHTIPHSKAIEKLSWPLAEGMTLELISFALFSKTFWNFFLHHPLFTSRSLKHFVFTKRQCQW